jgi:hypothetical protein
LRLPTWSSFAVETDRRASATVYIIGREAEAARICRDRALGEFDVPLIRGDFGAGAEGRRARKEKNQEREKKSVHKSLSPLRLCSRDPMSRPVESGRNARKIIGLE